MPYVLVSTQIRLTCIAGTEMLVTHNPGVASAMLYQLSYTGLLLTNCTLQPSPALWEALFVNTLCTILKLQGDTKETGPTMVGDEYSDPAIMNYLGARKTTMLGNNFSEYHVDDSPRLVLDKLEKIGFRVVTMTGVGQTLVWCMHKETD
ncbi:uncharacterized protein LOC121544952 isoform X1 [Coregonus clupeaformis]|uniref:uncharacterized protein LOC121544952 isoform X1 n=1 Tax=Coregonus clupeaformis TaxID=59861 RepID=UPI001BDF7641|nr:uncharacterized protein LOC121544952 isoform X1 [Coregonus clupeaformis]